MSCDVSLYVFELSIPTKIKPPHYANGGGLQKVLRYDTPENAIANHVDNEDKTTTLIQGTGSNTVNEKGNLKVWNIKE